MPDPSPSAAAALQQLQQELPRLHEHLRARELETVQAWVDQLQPVLGEAPLLQRLELDLALHAHDLPLQAHRAATLQKHAGEPGVGPLEPLLHWRFEALLGLADPASEGAADAALAALPASSDSDQRHHFLQGARLAWHRYKVPTAISLLQALEQLCPPEEIVSDRLEGLDLAERLCTMQGLIPQAQQLRLQIRSLLLASPDPQQRLRAAQEPWRMRQLEMRAQPAALATWLELRQQSPQEACRAIAAAVPRHPESTAFALGLLQELRRAGWIGIAAPIATASTEATQAAASPIPRRLWLLRRHPQPSTDSATGSAIEQLEQRWRLHHPGWQLHWLDHDPSLAATPDAAADAETAAPDAADPLPPLVAAALSCLHDPAIRGDLLRLARLWQYGGVAVDWNARSQRSLTSLLGSASLLLVQDADGALSLDLIAASARHPFLEAALGQICRNVLNAEGFNRWDISTGSPLSIVFARWSQAAVAAGQLPAGVRIVSVHELRRWLGLGLHLPPPPTAAVDSPRQLFNHQRRRQALAALTPS